ncbi:MAG: RNA-binding protein [Bdellovibrionales bacterium]|nr:RNA-binding protein [Bdellovibrionales bacterium]
MSKLYVGNLSYNVTESELNDLFSPKGEVVSVKIISDHQSGRSKGFGFVEMSSKEESEAVISAFNGYDLKGRPMRVNESIDKPRKRNNRGSGGGGGRRW